MGDERWGRWFVGLIGGSVVSARQDPGCWHLHCEKFGELVADIDPKLDDAAAARELQASQRSPGSFWRGLGLIAVCSARGFSFHPPPSGEGMLREQREWPSVDGRATLAIRPFRGAVDVELPGMAGEFTADQAREIAAWLLEAAAVAEADNSARVRPARRFEPREE